MVSHGLKIKFKLVATACRYCTVFLSKLILYHWLLRCPACCLFIFRTCQRLCYLWNAFPQPFPVAGLSSPSSFQLKWYLWRGAFYLNGLYFYIFIVLLPIWNGFNLLDCSLYTCFQSHDDRNCVWLSFLLFWTVPKHIGNEMLGKFYLPDVLLKNPLFYYVYTENFPYKMPC